MSSNFERFHKIINQAYAENFSCLFHVEPRNLPRWSGLFSKFSFRTWQVMIKLPLFINIFFLIISFQIKSGWETKQTTWAIVVHQTPADAKRKLSHLFERCFSNNKFICQSFMGNGEFSCSQHILFCFRQMLNILNFNSC